jgi:REP element-mobilizing transposase RayT
MAISSRHRKAAQLTLESARKPTGHGGWRPGAGRPRGRKTVSHDARERFAARHPLHITLRIRPGVQSLRRGKVCATVRAALTAGGHKPTFRVVEFNVLSNHLHLLVEADGLVSLARGMQGLQVRLARRINRLLGRTGSLFASRYHARALRTPREVRNALRYVLLNARHHAAERGRQLARDWIDPYSSAPWFAGCHSGPRSRGHECLGVGHPCPPRARGQACLGEGHPCPPRSRGHECWLGPPRSRQHDCPGSLGPPRSRGHACPPPDWLAFLQRQPRPTATARTWLLATGWRRHGLLLPTDVPGRPS